MEEVLTCKCGCQLWAIYSDRILCTKCGLPAQEAKNKNLLNDVVEALKDKEEL